MMKAKEELISLMENCLHGLETAPKRLFGAEGKSKQNKVFVMITKNSEFVVKSDDSEQFEELQKKGATRWSPHPNRGPMGTWLVLSENMLDDFDGLVMIVKHCYDNLNL